MTAEQVLATLALFTDAGVVAWVDGGWGIDALVGRESRRHSDLDLAIIIDHVPTARSLLEDTGFAVIRDWLPTAIAFRHPDGREVDVHPFEPTADGGGDQIQLDGIRRFHYDPPVTGTISGHEVPCCSASTQVRAHMGYEPTATDHADMQLLREHLDVELPEPYDRL